jgi:DNA end-binding protein Ku
LAERSRGAGDGGGAVPQSVWSGTISFGLVMLPVKLYPATKARDVRFHEFDASTGRRIRHRRVVEDTEPVFPSDAEPPSGRAVGGPGVDEPPPVAPPWADQDVPEGAPAGRQPEVATEWVAPQPEPRGTAEREVSFGDVALGYEIEPGRTVLLSRDEIRELRPQRSGVVEIEEFVDLASIDPIWFEKSYYAVPQPGAGGERPYALLVEALEQAGRVGIGRIVLRTKEHLAAIRPTHGVLALETLFHADEVRDPVLVYRPPAIESPTERELRIATQLIDMLAADWDPARYEDRDRARLLELIERRAGERVIATPAEAEPPSNVTDLMEALRASVEAIKERDARGDRGERRTG